ncbi:MAG: hypothetical protein IJP54_07285, partial [Synergistaceae bacterium]|nr:hypothetical protein [Synergistaceae bacterium]
MPPTHLRIRRSKYFRGGGVSNFPDEIFREYVSTDLDLDHDGVLSDEEIAAVTGIDVTGLGIKSLKGIEYFTALKELICSGNQLTELDVSSNTLLTGLACDNNQIVSLDLSSNVSLDKLYCSDNQLASLTFGDTPTDLQEIICSGNQLTELDVSSNTKLSGLDCSNNQLTSLTLGDNSVLEYLDCTNNSLTKIDLSGCSTMLLYISYGYSDLVLACDDGVTVDLGTSIDDSNFPDTMFQYYVYAFLDKNFDGILSTSEKNAVTEIKVSSLDIASLQGIEYFPALETLDCSSNSLTALDLTKNTALASLNCSSNSLTALDLTNNTALKTLNCSSNQLEALDVSMCTSLNSADCSSNKLTSLTLGDNEALLTLNCTDNTLTEIDISGCPNLTNFQYDTGTSVNKGIAVDEANFPDEVFRAYVKSKFDTNSDDILNRYEIAAADSIDIRGTEEQSGGVSSLKGIEYFTALQQLRCF